MNALADENHIFRDVVALGLENLGPRAGVIPSKYIESVCPAFTLPSRRL